MNNSDKKIEFGLANIRIGEGEDAVFFDSGCDSITLTPLPEDITIADFGTSYSGEVTLILPKPCKIHIKDKTTGETLFVEPITRELGEAIMKGEIPFSFEWMALEEKFRNSEFERRNHNGLD